MSGFVPNKLVQECIANNDIRGLKGAFVGIIFSDRSFSKGDFENTLNYIDKETNIKIRESFDNGQLLSKSGRATEDDFEEAVYNLKVNFCSERIKDVKALGRALYGKKMTSQTTSSTTYGGSNHGKKTQGHQEKESNTGLVIAGIVAVAAIAIAVGFVIKGMK